MFTHMFARQLVKRKLFSLRASINHSQARNYAKVTAGVRYASTDAKEEVLMKYKEKLDKKAKELGAKDVDELKDKLKEEIKAKMQHYNKIDPLKELDEHLSKANESGSKNPNIIKINKPLAPKAKKDDRPPFKTLSSFVDVEKISQLSADDIGLIWRARFQSDPQNVCSVISKDIFDSLYKTARKNPFFILPLKKENQGHELHFVQWSFTGPYTTHVIFTTLAEYKLHNEFAKPHTTLTFHKELEADKGIVLMNGHVEKDSNVNLSDSQLLILNLQNFYGGLKKDNSKRLALLEAFNQGTPDFSIEELIKESQDVE